MENKLKAVELFEAIQGEGLWAGVPCIFLRLADCTRKCTFCDTDYKTGAKWRTITELNFEIRQFGPKVVVITGGEPLIQWRELRKLVKALEGYWIHIETNGDLLGYRNTDVKVDDLKSLINFVSISPKDKEVAAKVFRMFSKESRNEYQIKVVTDGKSLGLDMVPFATTLMPMSTGKPKQDLEIKRRVWKYCMENGIRYSPRLHIDVWGYGKKGK